MTEVELLTEISAKLSSINTLLEATQYDLRVTMYAAIASSAFLAWNVAQWGRRSELP